MIFINMHADPDISVAAIDNYSGARLATEHLLRQGYQNVALITGPLDWWEAQQRKLGWQAALEAAGRPPSEAQIAEGDWSAYNGQEAFCALREKFPQMDAIFTSNDQTALGVIHAARGEGLHIPNDLGLVGFDNIPESAFFLPPLTTIEQPLRELGGLAVKELGRIIHLEQGKHEPFPPASMTLEPTLIIRESSIPSR
jgi:DNA-binding LacI/PurR family transcriptional regulator